MPAPLLRDVVAILDHLYDPSWAMDWDSVGLAVGDPDVEVRRVLLAVDPVVSVIAEAVAQEVDLLITHHPLLLRAVNSVSSEHPKGRAVSALIRAGIGLHVAHTNADVANPGVSDALAGVLALGDTVPLQPLADEALDKLVVFVPSGDAERLIDALAAAGAGRLGDYERAAWSSRGTGTFLPLPGANPTVGDVGTPATVEEARVEMVLPRARTQEVVRALRVAHPYEEPAFDVLARVPSAGRRGLGRVGELERPESLSAFAERVKAALPRTPAGIRIAGDPERLVRHVAVCGGAGDDLFDEVRGSGADVYVTADLRHHPASEAIEHGGPALVDCSHWATEWPWLLDAQQRLAAGLAERNATVDVRVSRLVTDPWTGV